MRTTPFIAATAAALTLAAPARADHVRQECSVDSVAQGNVTNDLYTGVAVGHVVGSPGEPVSITCEIRVNGVRVDGTGTGTGTTAAATVGVVRFAASDSDVVTLCAVYTSSHGTQTSCQPVG